MSQKQIKGFTLIELIITISILAILIAIVVVALNPAEQLQRSRDTKRVADLDAIKTAINLYLAQATTTINLSSGSGAANADCWSGTGNNGRYFMNTAPATFTGPATGPTTVNTSTGQTVLSASAANPNTTSWMPALLGQTPGGAPLATIPLDPTNGAGTGTSFFYAYACKQTSNTFELTARLESNFYKNDLDQDGTDGGNSTSTYEVGTDLTIIPNAF